MALTLRPATPDDASELAVLANIAGEGLPFAYWDNQGDFGQDALEVGTYRFKQLDGLFTWRRVTVAELDGQIAGMSLAHTSEDVPKQLDESMHPMVRPVVRLAIDAVDTHSLNTVAVYPQFRRQKIATSLVRHIEAEAGRDHKIALVTSDINDVGQAFGAKLAYTKISEVPVIKGGWDTKATKWQLLHKVN